MNRVIKIMRREAHELEEVKGSRGGEKGTALICVTGPCDTEGTWRSA